MLNRMENEVTILVPYFIFEFYFLEKYHKTSKVFHTQNIRILLQFLGRNMTKRTRAEQKFNEMNAMKLEYTEKINKMKMESEDIKKYTEAVKQNVSTHRIYEVRAFVISKRCKIHDCLK